VKRRTYTPVRSVTAQEHVTAGKRCLGGPKISFLKGGNGAGSPATSCHAVAGFSLERPSAELEICLRLPTFLDAALGIRSSGAGAQPMHHRSRTRAAAMAASCESQNARINRRDASLH
jgi:hypothetical protein